MLSIPEKIRKTLTTAAVAIAALGLAYTANVAKEAYQTYQQTETVIKIWEKVRENKASLYPYQIEQRQHLLDQLRSYWIRRLKKPEKPELVIAEGIIPTFRLVNEDGFDINLNRIPPDKIRQIFQESGFNITSAQAESFSLYEESLSAKKELVLDGKSIKKIIIFGDSWGIWGGNAYSIPTLLDTLFILSGYDVQVLNASILGGNIYDLPEDIQAQLADPDTLFIPFIQPDTDFSDDMNRINSPLAQDPRALSYWFAEDPEADLKQILKHEVLEYARYTPWAYALQFYWIATGQRDKHPVSQLIKDPDFKNHPYLQGFGKITQQANLTRPVLLPPVWMIRTFAQDFAKLQQMLQEQFPHLILTELDDMEAQLDEKAHPNPAGSLQIATQIFVSLTGSEPPPEILQKAQEITDKRIRALEQVFIQADPVFPDFTPLYPDLYP